MKKGETECRSGYEASPDISPEAVIESAGRRVVIGV
jgi:hypothetical protein